MRATLRQAFCEQISEASVRIVGSGRLGNLYCAAALFVAVSFGHPAPANAAPIIEFTTVDLSDPFPGEDLWQYAYTVSGFTFNVDQGFSVYFDPNLYSDLVAGSAPPDWDILTIQPDPVLGDDGSYGALATVNLASLANPFVVTFQWLGGASGPGSQPFTIDEFDESGAYTELDSGVTRRAIPEPATLLLLAPALAYAMRRRRTSF